MTQADPARVEVVAAAVEMIHAYSLVHDDLPCMDNDSLRRGRPTCHVEFDEATALLVGDALQPLAFQLLAAGGIADDAAAQLEMLRILALASGSRGMAGGQAIDLASVGETLSLPELEFMHILKTGALIRASLALGARCGKPLARREADQLDRYAKCVGLAFQVVDDVLDAEAPSRDARQDRRERRGAGQAYLCLAARHSAGEGARAGAERDAHAALEDFGPRAARLRDLADFIVMREF